MSTIESASIDDMIIALMIDNCDTISQDDYESTAQALSFTIAQFLRINSHRIETYIENINQQNYCTIQVVLKQESCAGNLDIITLTNILESAVMSPLSELHDFIANHIDISDDVSLEHVFYIQQTPQHIIYNDGVSITADEIRANNVLKANNDNSSSNYTVFIYAIIGAILGFISVRYMLLKYMLHNKSNTMEQNLINPNEKRTSIYDFKPPQAVTETDFMNNTVVDNTHTVHESSVTPNKQRRTSLAAFNAEQNQSSSLAAFNESNI